MKRIRNFTTKLPGLERIAAQATALEQLLRLTRDATPEPLRPHIHACAVRDRTLVVFTDSGNWGSQLRFIQPAILDAIHENTGYRLDAVRFKVQATDSESPAPEGPARHPPQHQRRISQRSRAIIDSAAEGISDPDLAAALHRLAQGNSQD